MWTTSLLTGLDQVVKWKYYCFSFLYQVWPDLWYSPTIRFISMKCAGPRLLLSRDNPDHLIYLDKFSQVSVSLTELTRQGCIYRNIMGSLSQGLKWYFLLWENMPLCTLGLVLRLTSPVLDNMLNTLGSEGGRFVARQSEVSQPVLGTVGNISNTIHG